jgi:predicted amidohydrolase YtcJ
MKALNVVPAEFSIYPYCNSDKFHFFGKEMMSHMTAFRTLIDAGIVPSAGSDFSPAVLAADIYSRHGDAHGVERRDLGSEAADKPGRDAEGQHHQWRHNSCEEAINGSITSGKLADDLHTVDKKNQRRPGRSHSGGRLHGLPGMTSPRV